MAGQAWTPAAEGGYLANPKLSRQLRHVAQPLLRFLQFARQEPGIGKHQGETIDFDKISNIATAASQTGLVEGVPIPKSKFTITKNNLIVREYGNSIPYTGKLEALAEFDPNNLIQKVLKDDMAKTMDAITAAYFKACQVIATPGAAGATSITQAAAPSLACSRNMSIDDVRNIVDYMKATLKVEPYDGENYVCIGSVRALRGVMNSDDWKQGVRFGDPSRLFRGEVGTFEGVRFIESNNDLALEDNINSTGCGEAVFFGADPVIQGVTIAPEVRAAIPGDFGRDKGVAWYALMGWATPWRAVADAGQARGVWLTGTSNVLGPPSGY